MVTRATVLSLSVLLIFSCPLSTRPEPQASPEAASPQQETVIRSSVRLVQVSVVVEDKKGNLVTGLKQNDFTGCRHGHVFFTESQLCGWEPFHDLMGFRRV